MCLLYYLLDNLSTTRVISDRPEELNLSSQHCLLPAVPVTLLPMCLLYNRLSNLSTNLVLYFYNSIALRNTIS